MRLQIVIRYIGIILLFISAFMFISACISGFLGETAFLPLLYSAIISMLFGVFPIIYIPAPKEISTREGFLIVALSWILSCLVGVIPYILWGGEFTFTNAWFESVSGFTTTGSSILSEIESLPKGLLFWRSSTHWIGGIGIVIFVLSILPALESSRLTLYRSEMSSLAVESFKARTQKTFRIILVIYLGLTLLETVALMVFGMDLFDAINHTFATVATGGFSTKNSSIASFNSVEIEVVIMIFMVLSGVHFGLLYYSITVNPKYIWQSSVVKYYIGSIFIGILLITINIYLNDYYSLGESLRFASFQVISLGTTTGFASIDTALWPAFSILILIFFTLQCGCAGSTSGGIKVDRMVIFFKSIKRQLRQLYHPKAVTVMKVDGNTIPDLIIHGVILYIIFYILVVFVSSVCLTALEVDIITSFSASAAAMGNVGPGFGSVSSLGNFGDLPILAKWILTIVMLLGRLEIYGLILLFKSREWK
jgi:trk system potassium uptake protein